MLEEWEYYAGSRLKSVIILGLVLLTAVQFAERQPEEERLIQESGSSGVLQVTDDEKLLQTRLEQAETDFHEAVEQLAADNNWSAQYTKEAERYYQQYAEVMSWALVYYQEIQTEDLWKEDLIRKKAVQKEVLFRDQSDKLNNYLKLRKE